MKPTKILKSKTMKRGNAVYRDDTSTLTLAEKDFDRIFEFLDMALEGQRIKVLELYPNKRNEYEQSIDDR